MSALLEIGDLVRARPSVDAAAATLAAWYERKAVVLSHIAAETAVPSERATYVAWAQSAHRHAERLR